MSFWFKCAPNIEDQSLLVSNVSKEKMLHKKTNQIFAEISYARNVKDARTRTHFFSPRINISWVSAERIIKIRPTVFAE